MKIAIVQPKNPNDIFMPALGLLYIAALLEKNGFIVKVFDENYDPDYFDKIIDFKPSLVGFTCITSSINRILKASEEFKKRLPYIKLVLGGPHITVMADEVMKNSAVDYCIVGEGEYPMLKLSVALTQNVSDVSDINNLVYRSKGAIVRNKSAPVLNEFELDNLPYPAFHLLDLREVFRNSLHGTFSKGKRILPIMSSRGCSGVCTYCCRMMGNKIRYRSSDSIISEIRYLVEKFRADEIYFEDDNFTADKNRALKILEEIRINFPGLYIKFANGLRADEVDEDILKYIKQAGGYWVGFGIESGCPATLKLMRKNLNLDIAKKNVIIAKKIGLKVGSNCIIGYPGETLQNIEESLRFFEKLNLDSLAIVSLIPFPGTEAHALCKKNGYLTESAKNYDNYCFQIYKVNPLIRTPMLNDRKLKRLIKVAYLRLYFLSTKRMFYLVKYFIVRKFFRKIIKKYENTSFVHAIS